MISLDIHLLEFETPKSTLFTQFTSMERLLKHLGLQSMSSTIKEHIRDKKYPFDPTITV